jgi:hypothetical protein
MPYQATTPSSDQIGILHAGSTPVQVQVLAISITATGVIIPAPPTGYQIALVQIFLSAGAAFTAVSLYSTTTTGLSIPFGSLASGATVIVPYSPCPWLICGSGESLTLAKTGSGTLSGSVNYLVMPIPSI